MLCICIYLYLNSYFMQFYNYYIDLNVVDAAVKSSLVDSYLEIDYMFCYSIYHLLFLILAISLLIIFCI